jgi:hypothetical protein
MLSEITILEVHNGFMKGFCFYSDHIKLKTEKT